MERKRKKFILFILIIVIAFNIKVFGAEEIKTVEKSAEFEKWENLSEEERKNSIQPPYQTITFKDSVKRSTYNNLLNLRGSTLSKYYSLKDDINFIVKNQQQTNLCWAFSFTSALESTIAKKYNKDSLEYSPIYTDYVVTRNFRKDIGDGANSDIAIASAVAGNGLTYETDLPFNNYYNEDNNSRESFYLSYDNIDLSNINPKVKINETTSFAPIYKSYSEDSITYKDSSALFGATKYTDEEVEAIRTQIKRHIKDYGAVMSTVCTQNISSNYNEATNAFYTDYSMLSSDHAVTIVGWDDDYSKTNFIETNQPLNDGAYIVLNSWGNSFGNEGYFYVSYDDAFIEQYVSGIDDVQEYSEQEKDYDNLYQYDKLGSSIEFYFLNDNLTQMLTEGYLANVFSREDTNKYEYVTEVGIFVPVTQGVEIYIDYMNADMEDYELVASYKGSNALEPGYHNLKLSSPIKIEGKEFAVIVKYINSEGAMYALECNLKDTGLTEAENYFSTATSNKGESYISNDGSNWTDISEYKIALSQDELTTYKNTNACIKAFTVTSEEPKEIPVTSVEIAEENITIDKGNTANVVATIKPDNATNKNVTWSSLDEDIATVSNGVIKGESAGTTTVTVTTEDGEMTDSVRVTVIENEGTKTVNVTGVKLDIELEEGVQLQIDKGSTYTLNAIVEPSNATNKNISWESSDNTIATVKNGVITGISEGTATITVTTEDGNKTASVVVKVTGNSNIKVESVKLNKDTLNLEVGDTTNLVVTFNPVNANNKNVTWSSSNEKVASITKTGIITALEKGETIITVTTEDGNKTASCKLTVTEKTNTDDDIYKSDGNGNTTNKKDNTIAKTEFPNTGLRIVLIVLVLGVTLIGVISFIKYKKYSEIK